MQIQCLAAKCFSSLSPLAPVALPSLRETHFWYIVPDEVKDADLLTQYHGLLSPCENKSVFSMGGEMLQKRALLARVLVRSTLSRYTSGQVSPRSLMFKKNTFGKPEVEWQHDKKWDSPSLQFNLSHTTSLIACGVTIDSPIGIDIEDKERKLKNDLLPFARRYFSPNETEYLCGISDPDVQRQEFLKLWTLKVLAALGKEYFENILPDIIRNCSHQRASVRDGYLTLFKEGWCLKERLNYVKKSDELEETETSRLLEEEEEEEVEQQQESLSRMESGGVDYESGGSNAKIHHDEEHFHVQIPETAHQISQDTWFQAGFVLTTGINSAFVLGYSGTIMVPLGWIGGALGLVLAAAFSLYANILVAKLHEIGGKRHIRYRDLAGHLYGKKAYCLTWALQYINLFMINTGYIILAGQALKAVYVLYRDDHTMKLPYFIAISGFVCAMFAFGIPHLSALRIWLGVSTVLSLIYIIAACILSLRDGIKNPARDYNIPGSTESRVFTTIGASASLVFAYNTGMLPEIQATVKQPVVKNMQKALYFQFTAGLVPMYATIFIGYWAFGSSTSSYLLNNVSGAVWVKTLANIAAFLQTVIALHIFASPMYEYLDTRYGNLKGSPFSFHNLSFRICVRGGYLTINTLVAAMLPFLGDFQSLTGAFSTFPLTFILANHMYLIAKGNKLTSMQKLWHWFNICFFSFMSLAAAVAALRLIAVDSKTYHLFADL